MKKFPLFLFAATLCSYIVNAQTNYLDNYISNPVTLTTIGNSSNQINQPRDLDFKPNSNECWVANYGTSNGGTSIIFYNAGLPNQTSQYRKDTHTSHFMIYPSAIAFGDDGKWACVSEIQNTSSGTFMGPTLWLSDTNIFARVFQNNWVSGYPLGSHIDMLHQSPFSMGIAHDSLMAYWVMDGYNGNICKYDYVADHGPGYDNHSAGKIWRYTDVPVTRVVGVPSHMVLDKTNHWLYFIDGASKTIKRMNTLSGNNVGNLTAPNETLAGYYNMTGATVQVLATLATQPCGIDYYNGRLIVSDYTNGNIYLYSTTPSFSLLATINTGHAGMMGVKVGPDGHIWCVNYPENILYRLDVTLPATDVSIRSITSPVAENVTGNYLSSFYSTAFDVCSGSIAPSVTIANNGTNTVSTINMQYTIDGGSPVAYSWTGTLAPAATASVSLPSSAVAIGSHLLAVSILTVNGSPDAVDLNNTMTGSFRAFNPPSTLPFSEGFSSVTFPPAGWSYIHYNIVCKMSRATVGSFSPTGGSMKMDNWSGAENITGQKDYLMFPVIDFTSGTANTWLKFSVAHAQYSSATDAMQVQVSVNCGMTWTTAYNKSGAALATVSSSTAAFTPSATQWRTDSVSMAAYAGQPEVMLMFTTISNYGNNIYVDDINIGDITTGISETASGSGFSVYPNPAAEELAINLNNTLNESCVVRLTDITGKMVYSQQFKLQAGNNNISVPVRTINVEAGIYFLTVQQQNNLTTKKVVIQ
ncbi:MAG: T9SS type A sorting domain-containing protein [Bacteroidia bacterium]|nr:T9SS type A sorting domain-containing protein [Bacteroidia bacterium]